MPRYGLQGDYLRAEGAFGFLLAAPMHVTRRTLLVVGAGLLGLLMLYVRREEPQPMTPVEAGAAEQRPAHVPQSALDPNAHHFAPAWSPDGRLAYISNGPLSNDIYVDDQPVQSYANHSRVAWVSTSAFVASISDSTSTGTLYLVDLAKQWLTAIVGGWSGSPAVDPDGHRLAYEHPDANGWSIWIANVDGTSQTRVTRGFSDNYPAWSTDAQSILFARSGQGLFLYDVATSTLTQVTQRPVDAMAWAP
jgi:hypothetical protein